VEVATEKFEKHSAQPNQDHTQKKKRKIVKLRTAFFCVEWLMKLH